jgi:hypothetical protein
MMYPFKASRLGTKAPSDATFFTAVAAADSFVRKRMDGKYRDLLALIEFGDEAYVVTPFTTDYDNILISLSLINDLTEFNKFPDQGTTIAKAFDQGISLFKAFNFLDASGNIMVVFSDGEDTKVNEQSLGGLDLEEVLGTAATAKIPIYFIRTNFNQVEGKMFSDKFWKPAVEKTGGKFYAGSDEAAILTAIQDIDRAATGKVQIRHYSSKLPRFWGFVFVAVALWSAALAMKLTVPYFRKFP